jgi:hypothetical protein
MVRSFHSIQERGNLDVLANMGLPLYNHYAVKQMSPDVWRAQDTSKVSVAAIEAYYDASSVR